MPTSHLKLGSGFAPIVSFTNAGINAGIGTDGVVSNNDLNMFDELRTVALLAKGLHRDPTVIPAHQALRMATLDGAKALGLGEQIGSIEVGKRADLIAVDQSYKYLQPINNVISNLVYATDRCQVSHTWVDGKLVHQRNEVSSPQIESTV